MTLLVDEIQFGIVEALPFEPRCRSVRVSLANIEDFTLVDLHISRAIEFALGHEGSAQDAFGERVQSLDESILLFGCHHFLHCDALTSMRPRFPGTNFIGLTRPASSTAR